MSDKVLLESKVEHWKKQLLDLSKRNRMINYRETKRTTLKILEPGFTELFNRLAVSEEELTFQRPIDRDSDLRTFSMLSLLETLSYPIPIHMGDIKAEGSLLDRKSALNNLRSKSKLARDEQGTNILYLSFGFIKWRESDSAHAQWLKSPVLMMPVSLKLESIQSPYTLLRYDDDIEVNPTLDYLFNERYGIDLPTFELNGEESIEQYMETIEEIADQHGWNLIREVSLGLLSFLKISMYHDLNNNYERIRTHPVIAAMTGDVGAVNNIPQEVTGFDFDSVSPRDCYQVVNSDSSQQEAILLSKAGVSFVMQGPPGTGKSQTITNIIAEALADGKTILFVSEKAAALHVVYRRLKEVGLDDFCLALHSHKANKKEIITSIADNLTLPHKRLKDSAMFELNELFEHRQKLNQYVTQLHEEILPLGKSLYDAFGELSSLQSAPYVSFAIESPAGVSSDTYHLMLYRVDSYEKALKRLGIKISENPWRGTIVKTLTQKLQEDFTQAAGGLAQYLLVLDETLTDVIASFGLKESRTWAGAHRAVNLIQAIENTNTFPVNWAKSNERIFLLDKAKNGRQKQREYLEAYQNVLAYFDESIFSEDLASWLENVHQAVSKVKGINEHIQSEAEVMAQADCFISWSQSILQQLQSVLSVLERAKALLSFAGKDTFEDARTLAQILDLIEHCPAVKEEWFDSSVLFRTKQLMEDARSYTSSLTKIKSTLMQSYEPSVLHINADEMLLRFKTQYTSLFKVFKSSYWEDIKTIRGVSNTIGVKFSDKEIVTLLQQIGEINQDNRWILENQQQLIECFGNFYAGEATDWASIETGISFTEKMRSMFQQHVPKNVIQLLCDRAAHTDEYAKIQEILNVLNQETLDALSAELSEIISGYAVQDIKKQLLPQLSILLENSRRLITLITQIQFFESRPIPKSELIEQVTKAERIHEQYAELEKSYTRDKEFLGAYINGLETDWDLVIADLESVSTLFASSEASLMTDGFVAAFCDDVLYRGRLAEAKADLWHRISPCDTGYSYFKSLFEVDADFDQTNFGVLADRVANCLDNILLLNNWIACVEARHSCDEIGLGDFINTLAQADQEIEDVTGTFKRGFLTLWVASVMDQKKAVEQFSRNNQDEIIKRFVTLDEKQLLIAQERIRQNVIRGIPDTNRVLFANDELSILKREVSKKRRIMPLRKLFQAVPNLLLKLKPCMMMSPLSVAYFMEAKSYEFDMVIFDEASQIFPQDAVGSIFRGKQVIIAGDSRQLPPSNFFSTSTSNDDGGIDGDKDEDEAVGSEFFDSILEETAGVLPTSTLLWHYRSKHESLIAFSNQAIYKNELITFPSNVSSGVDTGVELVFVEDGIYEGKGRNTAEACRCVFLVQQHIDKTPNRSLGIIAFSENQQKAIAFEIQKFREQHPEYESFFAEKAEDEFFVKNLENVQGDERDTIIFSVSYGKTKEQRENHQSMALRFGPLGQKGGERRLNVAITRAKCNIKLVSSILPSDIDVSRTESEGVKMLQKYIAFAMHGSDSLRKGQGETQRDGFVDVVATYLMGHGYKISKYIGCSGYKIDLAVWHPGDAHCFVAGIECDGPSYAAAKNARDRDHLRKSVLEAMGWHMYRVWSPEWMARRDIEGEKLLTFIETTLKDYKEIQKTQPPKLADQSNVESIAEVIEENKTHDTPLLTASIADDISNPYGFAKYVEADWRETPQMMQFHGDDSIAEAMKYIVGIEQPICMELLYQRMAGVFGNQKVTTLVRGGVDRVMQGTKLKDLIVRDKDGFVTLAGFTDLKARVPAAGNTARQIHFISPDEIGMAMIIIASQAIGLTSEGLIDATVKALGYARKGERMLTCMNKALERLIKRGLVRQVDEKVRVIGGDNCG